MTWSDVVALVAADGTVAKRADPKMSNARVRIVENYARLRQQIEDAASRSGRTGRDVTLVAVTKYVGTDAAEALLDAGCTELGESRPQELWRKAEALQAREVNWHLVGHLQRNKVRRTLPCIRLLHSCDSLRLLDEVNRVAGERKTVADGLLEINISGDATKHGFGPEDLAAVLTELPAYEHVQICGLMAMASLHGDLNEARREFEQLRLLRDQLSTDLPDGVSLRALSMGMSRDFEVAIEEGATIVRVGSALFEGIEL